MSTNKKFLLVLIKIAVSATLLTLIFRKTGLENILTHLLTMDLRYFFLSSMLYIAVLGVSAERWRLILDGGYPYRRIFALNTIGAFFNNVLPGAIGGDAVKIYYLYKDTQKSGSSIASVFMDRFIGLFALLSIGLFSGIVAFQELKTLGLHWLIPAVFACFIFGSLLFFWLQIGRKLSVVSEFYDYFHHSLRKKMVLLQAYLLSFVAQMLSILMIYVIARGLGQPLSFTALFVFSPIISVITMVPISIAGLGLRESAFVLLFGLTGISPEASTTISFLWFLSIVMASTVGLVEYILYKNKRAT